jgi:hypothetical protein
MENRKPATSAIWAFCFLFAGTTALYGQHEQHSQAATPATVLKQAAEEYEHIFCPTMKTGQVCSHGTAATLGLQGAEAEAWVPLARKYNRAVNAATEQLFTDAEAVLTPEQLAQLKAWFAVGLNPQINDLLYAKGMGRPMAPAADAATKPADAMGEK